MTSGKIDRKNLVVPDNSNNPLSDLRHPANETQEKIMSLWSKVLDLRSMGIRDNFFELGGHSLKAIMLVTFLNKEFGCNLSLNDILINPTVEKLADLVNDSPEEFNHITQIEEQNLYNLSVFQRRLWVLDQVIQDKSVYNIPLIHRIDTDFHLKSFEFALKKLVTRHEILRTIILEVNGLPAE